MRLAFELPSRAMLATALTLGACGGMTTPSGSGAASSQPTNAYSPPIGSVVAVAAAGSNTCLVTTDAVVSCWGVNDTGQLGATPDQQWHRDPGVVPGLSPISDVRLGGGFACAVARDHSVSCWGANNFGQLGTQPPQSPDQLAWGSPTSIGGLTDVTALTVGLFTACARSRMGPWQCWGQSLEGLPSPTRYALPSSNVVQLAVGRLTASGTALCSIRPDGIVQCATGSQPFQAVVGVPAAVDVSVGFHQSCAATADGAVWCWGSNDYGELGVRDSSATGPVAVPGVNGAIKVSASAWYTCALLGSGAVQCWGDNRYGPLGTTDLPDGYGCNPQPKAGSDVCSPPVLVPGIDNATALATGGDHACVLRADGTVLCWGSGAH
jgi:alpha-tubulin suppressor-like RCC1 family protein